MFKSVQIKENLWWVGALDHDLRVFDIIMESPRGTSYNSYVVKGEKGVAVFEAAKEAFGPQWIERLSHVADPKDILYIVCDHTEPDHAGALGQLLDVAPNATVVSSRAANGFIREILNRPFASMVVKGGDALDLGGVTLRFIDAPFLHWPDSMFTYIPELKTLVSGDVFGYHYATDEVFSDAGQYSENDRKYYYTAIFSPFYQPMLEALDRIENLPIEVICPSHGPVYRTPAEVALVRDQYRTWSQALAGSRKPDTVFVGYVSAYGYTQALAEAIAEGARQAGHQVLLVEISKDPAAAAAQANVCGALAVGSPTFNRDALAPVWTFLSDLGAMHWRGRPALAFGSYAWSGEATGAVSERLKQLGFKPMEETLRVRLRPTSQDLDKAMEMGKKLLK